MNIKIAPTHYMVKFAFHISFVLMISNAFAITYPQQTYKHKNHVKMKRSTVTKAKPKTKTVSKSSEDITHLPWSLEIGLGYGKYQNMIASDGKTVLSRIGFGKEFFSYKIFHMGMEVGVQTGDNARLSIPESTQILLGGLPVDTVIKPMLDMLIKGKLSLPKYTSIYSQVKAGVIWRQWQFTRSSVNDLSKIDPELQVGIGWDINRIASLSLSYQHIFGGHPNFQVLSNDCEARVSAIPNENSVILGLSIYLNERFG